MKNLLLTASLTMLFVAGAVAQPEARLLRFPAVTNGQIVFTYAGDLYTVPDAGGTARKLTSHEGFEMFARFSPDGKWIAFTGQYDGNTEVYVIPSTGGIPRRLTYTATLGRDDVSDRMGPNNLVMGWMHDNRTIVFRSRMKEFNDFKGQLFTVTLDGDISVQLPLPRGGFCSYSPDDSKLVYNRVFREFRTWKRYRGGMADDIWIYDFKTKATERIAESPAGDIIPMWHGNTIYFVSDRDDAKRFNLYAYDLGTKETRKLTNYTEFDIKFPSLGGDAIVYENGGYIYRYDIATNTATKVSVTIAEDLVGGRGGIIEVGSSVTNFEISPDGNRALLGARGDVFTVPAKHGPTRNLTATPGVHERNSKWSPDGKWISYVSDASGEDEIWVVPQDGSAPATKLTSGDDTYMYQPYWSPDGKKLMWADKKLRLRIVDVASKNITDAATAEGFEFNDYVWSPDSRWIAYTRPEVETMNRVYLYSLESGKSIDVTDPWYTSGSPAFSPDGAYLYFVSSRDFSPNFSQTEFNISYADMSRIYLVTLTKSAESPFKPKSDEVAPKDDNSKDGDKKDDKKDEKKDEGKDDKKDAGKSVKVIVDFDGVKDRIAGLPISASNYGSLVAVGSSLYYTRQGSKDEKTQFLLYDFEELEEKNLGEVGGFEISADKKKMIVAKDRGHYIIDLPKAKIDLKDKLDLSGMEVKLDKKAEWTQMYNECWRQMKYFFYAPNMHGVDWDAVKAKYAPLVPYVNHRADLTYIIGEMIGELSAGHTYVGGGEYPKAARLQTGLLGAELQRDASSKFYKISKILKGYNWENGTKSPLTEIGVDANEGDYIVAVDGKPTDAMENIYESLVNTVGKQVKLTLNAKTSKDGGRVITVIPIDDESNLYYQNWVDANIAKVDKATNGKVGYVHIPDMGVGGLNEFVRRFYPQLKKKALIVDVRGNGGGFVSPIVLERLRRELAFIDFSRNTAPFTDPQEMIWGPKVCLIDEFSASDGDIFPYRFKKAGLGKLVGKRTWGGVVGIRGTLPLLDGGFLNKPEFSRYDEDGNWIMEGVGVEPDIFVDNDPAREFAGDDQQLTKGIEVILEELKTKERTIPPIPDYPVKK